MGESVLGHPPPCFVLCTGRSAPVLVLLLLLILILVLVLVLVLLVLLLLILVLLILLLLILVLLILVLLILVLLIFAGHRGTSFRICDTASVCPKTGGAYILP